MKIVAILIAFLVVAANIVFDHYAAPSGLLLIPLVAALTTGLIMFKGPQGPPYRKMGFCVLLLVLQDVGIKLWGGGAHDDEGQGVFNLLLLIGALISWGILALALRQDQRYAWWHQAGAFLVFPLLIFLHLELFTNLRNGLYYDL